jgi:hypothetical protein
MPSKRILLGCVLSLLSIQMDQGGSPRQRRTPERRRPGRPYRYETDAVIQSILQEDSNASLRIITEALSISPETVRTHMSRIGYTLMTLRWIPHALTSQLNQIHSPICLQLLSKLRADAHDNWRHLVTGDEIWFYYEYVRERIWAARDENTPEVENRIIISRKSMLTVL